MDWLGDAWHDITTPQPVPSSTVVLLTAAGVLLVLVVPIAWHVARHGADDRARGGARGRRGARRPTAVRHPGALGHLGPDGLGGQAARAGHGRDGGRGVPRAGGRWASARRGCCPAGTRSRCCGSCSWCSCWCWCRSATGTACGRCSSPARCWWRSPCGGRRPCRASPRYAMTWFLLLGAPRAVLEMQSERRRGRRRGVADTSDAGLLGRLTHLPGGLWVAILLLRLPRRARARRDLADRPAGLADGPTTSCCPDDAPAELRSSASRSAAVTHSPYAAFTRTCRSA